MRYAPIRLDTGRNHDMAELDGDRPVWAWYDSFSGVWRHRLSTPGGAG